MPHSRVSLHEEMNPQADTSEYTFRRSAHSSPHPPNSGFSPPPPVTHPAPPPLRQQPGLVFSWEKSDWMTHVFTKLYGPLPVLGLSHFLAHLL